MAVGQYDSLVRFPYQQNIRPGWIGDFLSREHVMAGGGKIDATTFYNDDAIQYEVEADVLLGATAIELVAPVSEAGFIPANTLLDFGALAQVTVEVWGSHTSASYSSSSSSGNYSSGASGSGAAQGATSIPIIPLTEPLPAGALLQFGVASAGKFAMLSVAAQKGQNWLTVYALPTALVAGDIATYGGIDRRIVKVTQDVDPGDQTLHVTALDWPLFAGESAYYSDPRLGKRIAAGRIVSQTWANIQAGANGGFKWHKAVDGEDQYRIIAYDIQFAGMPAYNPLFGSWFGPYGESTDDVDLIRPQTLIYANNLPGWSSLSSAVQAAILSTYQCTVAAPGQEVAA